MISKHDSKICCVQQTHFKFSEINRLKTKGLKKICHVNIDQKPEMATLIADKVVSKQRILLRQKGILYNDKGSVY